MTREDAANEVARLKAARVALKARREVMYATGAVAIALAYEDEIYAMVGRSDELCEEFDLPFCW